MYFRKIKNCKKSLAQGQITQFKICLWAPDISGEVSGEITRIWQVPCFCLILLEINDGLVLYLVCNVAWCMLRAWSTHCRQSVTVVRLQVQQKTNKKVQQKTSKRTGSLKRYYNRNISSKFKMIWNFRIMRFKWAITASRDYVFKQFSRIRKRVTSLVLLEYCALIFCKLIVLINCLDEICVIT